MKKHHRKSRWWNFESMCALFVLCTCITTLHLCYMRMHSFSANQKGIIFSCTLLPGEIFTQIVSNEIILSNKTKQYWITNDTQQEIALCIPLSLTVSYRWSSCEGYSSLYHSPTQHTKFQRWNSPERRRKIDVQSKNLVCWSIWSFNIHTPPPPRHFNLWRLFCSNSQLDNSIPLSHLYCAGTTVKCQGVSQWGWGCWSSKLIGAQVLEHSFYISRVCRWWIHIT